MARQYIRARTDRTRKRAVLWLCTKSPKSHPRQWVVHSNAFYRKLPSGVEIPPTAVGGSFKYFLREDLKYPPTAVGGITKRFRGMSVERDLNQSTHCRWVGLGLFVQSRTFPRSLGVTMVIVNAYAAQHITFELSDCVSKSTRNYESTPL